MKNSFNILLNQLKSPLIYILFVALSVSIYFNELAEIIIISSTIILNTALGFYQEYKAFSTFQKLKTYIKPSAIVEKDGKFVKINAEELKIDDIVILNIDNSVPADGEILNGEIVIDEKILTGESLPVTKIKGETVYLGCTVISGFGKVKVTSLGESSKFGKIVKYVTEEIEPITPLQKQLSSLGKFLSIGILSITLIIFIFGIVNNYEIKELLKTSIALAVATVPEGLVVALTIILAVGMNKILKQNAVVRKLIAAETLGSVTTICLDKTGTITEGNLKVHKTDIKDPSMFQLINNYANLKIDTLELAIDDWAKENISLELSSNYDLIKIIPFNSNDKFSGAIVKKDDKEYYLTYGAAEIILNKSNLNISEKETLLQNITSLSNQGIKLLGYAYKEINLQHIEESISDLTWVGFIGLSDKVRPEIKTIIEECRNAGVKLKLISGDNINTSISIATEVGILDALSPKGVTGKIFQEMNKDQKRTVVKNFNVFAQTTPMQKLEILEILKDDHEIVAMIGDGVNDAPALKLADIGVVVNEASDIAKDVADIVLIDSNFKTIVNAIREGRIVFKNIQKVVFYLIMDSFSEVLLISSSIFLGLPLALSAIQILWINLIEDTLPALSLAFEPAEKGLMQTKPIKKGAAIINKRLQIMMGISITVSNSILIFIQYYLSLYSADPKLNQTIIFACLTFSSLIILFSCKDLSKNIWEYNPFSNKYLNISLLISGVLLIFSLYIPVFNNILGTSPLSYSWTILVLGYGICTIAFFEIIKYLSKKDINYT